LTRHPCTGAPVHNGDAIVLRVAKMVVLCSVGTKDPDGKTAEPGCHGSSKFKGKKKFRTVGYAEKHGAKRLEELEKGDGTRAFTPVLPLHRASL